MNLGGIYQNLGNLDEALASTLKSLEFRQENVQALILLGTIYREKADHKNEKAVLDKAKAIEPSSLNIQLMAAQVFNRIHTSEREIDEERRNFVEATKKIQQNPNLAFQNELPIIRDLQPAVSWKRR